MFVNTNLINIMKKVITQFALMLAASTVFISCSMERNAITRGESGYGIGSGIASGSKSKSSKVTIAQEAAVSNKPIEAISSYSSAALAEENAKIDVTKTIEPANVSVRAIKNIKKQYKLSEAKTSIYPLVKTERKSPAKTMGDGSGWGIASLVCGILGLLFLPILFGPLAIIFGALGLNKPLKGLAISGMVLGFISLVVIFLLVGLLLAV